MGLIPFNKSLSTGARGTDHLGQDGILLTGRVHMKLVVDYLRGDHGFLSGLHMAHDMFLARGVVGLRTENNKLCAVGYNGTMKMWQEDTLGSIITVHYLIERGGVMISDKVGDWPGPVYWPKFYERADILITEGEGKWGLRWSSKNGSPEADEDLAAYRRVVEVVEGEIVEPEPVSVEPKSLPGSNRKKRKPTSTSSRAKSRNSSKSAGHQET